MTKYAIYVIHKKDREIPLLHIPFNDASGRPFCLIELAPDHTEYLHAVVNQRKDKIVHHLGLGSVEEMRDLRVPMGPGFAKAAFATVCHQTNKLGSVIFGHKNDRTITSGADLQGDVHAILHQKANTPFDGAPTAMVFYEITSLMPNTGADLIMQLLHNIKGFVPATLSPLRTVRRDFPQLIDATLSSEETLALAYKHLLGRSDHVQKFHMGNGAIIRDIKLNANTPDSDDGVLGKGIMINYGYTDDVSTLETNRAKLKTITSGAAPAEDILHLTELPLVQRVMDVVSMGALKALYPQELVDGMKRTADAMMKPAFA